MLESLRRSGASIFVYLIFGLLIVIFVINFAPSRKSGDEGGCRGASNVVVSVDGSEANQTAYHIAYSYAHQYLSDRYKDHQQVYLALDLLIRRELLATAAAEHGLRVSGELADEAIKQGYFFLGGMRIPLGLAIFDEVDGEKFFNIKKYKNWVNSLNVSPGSYRDEQARGLQASMMSQLIEGSVNVSRNEALADYLYDNNTVTYDVVAFSPNDYRSAMKLTDADLQRFATSHEDEVKAKYKADERTYKAVKPQLQLRSVFIAKLEPAADAPSADKPADKPGDKAADKAADKPDATKKPDKAAADKKPAVKPVGMPIEEAKAKLDEARAAIASGKKKLADVATALSTDDAAKANGGELGWRTADNAQIGEKAVSDAIKTLKPGEMTPVIATERGVYLVMAEAKREGDLTYDQVKLEIASDLARDTWSKEAAKRGALAALDAARGGKPLDQQFERAAPQPHNNSIEDMLNDPNMPAEKKQQIIEMLKKQMEQGDGPHGALEVESKDIPAAWSAGVDGDGAGAGGGAGTPAATTGSAAGSGAAPSPPAPPPPPADVVASKDVLPAFGEVAKPKVEREGPTPRTPSLPGIGVGKALIDALFDQLKDGETAKKVFESEGSYVVVQLVTHAKPNVTLDANGNVIKADEFDKVAAEKIEALRSSRGHIALEDWLRTRCEALVKAGKIKPAAELLREVDDKGKPIPSNYHPCSTL